MPYLYGIVGDVGSGKTNIMTRYMKLNADEGTRVITNYPLIGIKHTLMSFQEFVEVIQSKNTKTVQNRIGNSVIGWDELGVGADSYEFFAKETKALTEFGAQMRKFHVTAYYTVQRYSMVAKRLRIMTGGFLLMDDLDKGRMKDKDGNPVRQHRDVCDGLFQVTYTNEFLEPQGSPRTFNGRPYWNMYNTDVPIWV